MTRAIRIHEHGGPDVLRWEQTDPGAPGPCQALIRQTAAGLNFIDVYHRTGLYPVPGWPAIIGNEAAGVVEAVGDGVTKVAAGDRVAYCMSLGAYAERRVIDAAKLVKLPDAITDRQAAAMMLKGCTVQYLVRRIHPVKPGDTILLHAAAGGVGLIACQWAKHLGATVIGTVGSDAKAELARAHGCDHPIVYTREDVVERVRELTGGAGVPVALRLGGEGHLRRLPRLPAAAGAHGEQRQRVGGGGAVQPWAARRQGVAVPDPPDAGQLHRDEGRNWRRPPASCSRWSAAAPSRST